MHHAKSPNLTIARSHLNYEHNVVGHEPDGIGKTATHAFLSLSGKTVRSLKPKRARKRHCCRVVARKQKFDDSRRNRSIETGGLLECPCR